MGLNGFGKHMPNLAQSLHLVLRLEPHAFDLEDRLADFPVDVAVGLARSSKAFAVPAGGEKYVRWFVMAAALGSSYLMQRSTVVKPTATDPIALSV
jgi:hypothetical protein